MSARLTSPSRRRFIARLMSIALQHGASLERLSHLTTGAQFGPYGPGSGHDREHRSSLPDRTGRHLLIEYCGINDRAHVQLSPMEEVT